MTEALLKVKMILINIQQASLQNYTTSTDDEILKYMLKNRGRHYSHKSRTSYNSGKLISRENNIYE